MVGFCVSRISAQFPRGVIERFILSFRTGTVVANIAKSRAEIEGARLLVLSAAHQVRDHEFSRL